MSSPILKKGIYVVASFEKSKLSVASSKKGNYMSFANYEKENYLLSPVLKKEIVYVITNS